ncbi:MAG: threonine synthase [Deltaproteobacteria bacterium]|nr:threonine synthase [Deltaproteobacteria bacterium]
MKYISTRGLSEPRSFKEAVIEGLARDGGLLVPESVPDFSSQLERLKDLSYQDLAHQIFIPFVNGELDEKTLKQLINASYQTFNHKNITPLRFTESVAILELFHGPTLAFKDIALQFLGNLFENLLSSSGAALNIVGATSGDTGSAAIHGVRGKKGITIFMLHPKGKISPIQEKQMTTVLDENVVNIAIDGTFDDAQRIVKDLFNDLEYKDQHSLGAVNSINWVRVMAQIVYYFYAAFRFREHSPDLPLVFSVPTGNFGDIYAGYLARKMGLPIEKLILATNENDILYRVITTGQYKIQQVCSTISPSMDIQISSNFERFLFDLVGNDAEEIRSMMGELGSKGEFKLSPGQADDARKIFHPVRVNTEQTLATIAKYHKNGYTIDPHTAVGVAAAEQSPFNSAICLATAHPAKFGDAVIKATGEEPDMPALLDGILTKRSRCQVSSQDLIQIKGIIDEKLSTQ